MSGFDVFDPDTYLAGFSNEELIEAAKECADDLRKASNEEPNSEWHQSCFAGMLCYAGEMSARGLKMRTFH